MVEERERETGRARRNEKKKRIFPQVRVAFNADLKRMPALLKLACISSHQSCTCQRQMASSSMPQEQPKGFESWRLACEAITGLSRYATKPGQSSQPRRHLLHSAVETKDELNELQDMLDDYVETEDEKKMHGVVEQWKNELVRTSPMIRFMAKHLSIVGCSPYNETISPTSKISPILITGCPPGLAGGFSPPQPGRPPSEAGIVVCSNRIMSKKHLENTMAHEMIHWWDNCRFQVDWNNLRHHACTEVSILLSIA
jgi:hypothetical protein